MLAGITDILDGMIASNLGVESEFGEKLDTIADFIFVISALYKLLPVTEIRMVLFIYPFSFSVIDVRYSSIAVCLLATFAALQESRFIRTKVCGK